MNERLPLDRTDGADLSVDNSKLSCVVEDGMDVESGVRGLSTELAQAMNKLFLELVGQVVLGAEEGYATLRDCEDRSESAFAQQFQSERTVDRKITDQLVGIGSMQNVIHEIDCGEFSAYDGCYIFPFKLGKRARGLQGAWV